MEFKDFGGLEFSPATLDELKHRLFKSKDVFVRPTLDLPLSTGSLSLDRATGIGGLPRGQLVLFTGTSFERSCALALALVSAVQKQGGRVVVIDATEGLWTQLREHAGIGEAQLAFLQAARPLDALQAARTLVESKVVDLVLLGPLAGAGLGVDPTDLLGKKPATVALRRELQALGDKVKGSRTAVVALEAGGQTPSFTSAGGGLKQTLDDLIGLKVSTRWAKGGTVLGGTALGGLLGQVGRLAVDVTRGGAEDPLSTIIDFDADGTVSKTGDLLEYGLSEGHIERRGSIYKTAAGETLGRGRKAAKRTLDAEADLGLALESMAERGVEELQRRSAGAEGPGRVYELAVEREEERAEEDIGVKSAEEEVERGPVLAGSVGDDPSPAARPKPAPRFLNTWFEGDAEPLLPLVVGEWTDFKFQIGGRRAQTPGGGAAAFVEPDFGSHSAVDLLVTLYSSDFQIAEANHTFQLQKIGDSPVQTTSVSPLHAGTCRLRLVVCLRKELELLQSVLLEVEAVAAAEAADAGGKG
jgi:recombination protein RecA